MIYNEDGKVKGSPMYDSARWGGGGVPVREDTYPEPPA